MGTFQRAVAAVPAAIAVALAPVRAQEILRPTHVELQLACVGPKERRALVESGTVMRLATAIYGLKTSVPGILLRARLCRRAEGFVYVLTVLAHDGKVKHVIVDAAKGTLAGER
jgi:hypothetical protein